MKSLIILAITVAIVALSFNQVADIVAKKLTNHVLVQSTMTMINKKVQ